MKFTLTINIPINPFIHHWSIRIAYLTAYAWNELIHWGMDINAPMYPAYILKKSTLINQIRRMK